MCRKRGTMALEIVHMMICSLIFASWVPSEALVTQ